MSDTWIILGAWVAAGLTIFLFSFLYKDNPFFKIAEHLYLGAGMGWWFQVSLYNVWIPKIWEPLKGGDFVILIPAVLGLSLVAQFFPKISWLSRYGYTFLMGYGAGLAIPVGISTDFIKQIGGTISPIFKTGTDVFSIQAVWTSFNIFLIAFGLVCVLSYFFFSIEHKGAIKKVSNIGVYFLMLYFGAAFGNTVMGRFSLLYGRFDDLYKYSSPKYLYATQFIIIGMIIYFIAWHFISKKLKLK
jgi:hypothetical protein